MNPLPLFAVLLTLAANNGICSEIYRWTDEHGRVHFSESVPESRKHTSRRVDTGNADISEERRREATASLKQAQPTRKSPATGDTLRTEEAPTPKTVKGDEDSCAEQWRRYHESDRCFAPFRLARGGIRPEAFERCQEVAKPNPCQWEK